jgi:hypothetical protein
MEPRKNPYAPGAGVRPPELAGRDEIVEMASIALDRLKDGKPAQNIILHGLRGVGKTVLLTEIKDIAEGKEIATVKIEAPEERSLPSVILPPLRSALLRLNRIESAKAAIARALAAMAGFAKALKVKYGDIEFNIDLAPEAGLADSGDLDNDLVDLLAAVGAAAKAARTALVLHIDELQYVNEPELASLISALHQMSQRALPVSMVAAGLPQLLAKTGRAKSYSERLFKFVEIGKLDKESARKALVNPAKDENVEFDEDAVLEVIRQTQGYPYFLQEWGKFCWDIAESSPITLRDAEESTIQALAELDNSFFRVRLDRLTPTEKRYMRAMAELGEGPHRSGDIAAMLNRKVTAVAPTRESLIGKGMIYSPSHGDTAFTVPLFDQFMKRVIPLMDPTN